MNRYRLNQILEVLLFPVLDPGLGVEDALLSCYEAYESFMIASHGKISVMAERAMRNKEYQRKQKELLRYLVERNHGRVKSEDYVQMLCRAYHSMGGIAGEMEYVREICRQKRLPCRNIEAVSSYYIKIMERISRSLITYRDGMAAVRQWKDKEREDTEEDLFGSSPVYDKIEIWNLLCRMVVPDIFIVIAAVENGLGPEALFCQQASIVLADKLLVKSLQNGVAENHLHFNVGFDYEINWLHYMDLQFAEKAVQKPAADKGDFYCRLEMALFRAVAAVYLKQEDGEEGFDSWLRSDEKVGDAVKKVIVDLYQGNYQEVLGDDGIRQIYGLYKKTGGKGDAYKCDYLMEGIYREYREYKTSSEYILLYYSYRHIKHNKADTFFARTFLQYIRLKNQTFHSACEQHVLQGLRYFRRKYDINRNALERSGLAAKDRMLEVFRSQMKMSYLKKLEIRVAPWVEETDLDHFNYRKSRRIILQCLYEQVSQILRVYKQFILENIVGVRQAEELMEQQAAGQKINSCRMDFILQELRKKPVNIPSLGIVFHFLKTENLEDVSGDYCWRMAINSMTQRSSSHLYKRYFLKNVAVALEEMRSAIPTLDEYIVGLDAASDENAMEPWIFAPAYRTMRSHKHTKPVVEVNGVHGGFHRIQNIGFTYHVGEDFRHIVSGFRHIDEVLEEFGYKAGDRLGHALVLGIDVRQWMDDNETVPLPLQEYLENLLWMWGINVSGEINLKIRLEVLEDKILDIAKELYPHPETITVKMLHSAYKKKFRADHREIAEKMINGNYDKHVFCRNDEGIEQCYTAWTDDKLLVTNYCPVFKARYEAITLVLMTNEEESVYRQLQEYLLQKVETKGIYIETNPTSNLSIGEFSQMNEHPIFHFYRGGREAGHHALVTINSDDPAVFNTNVENELAYIYYAAEAQGLAKSEILEWIDRIRQYGMDASFIQKEKSAEQIFTEIEEILESIQHVRI